MEMWLLHDFLAIFPREMKNQILRGGEHTKWDWTHMRWDWKKTLRNGRWGWEIETNIRKFRNLEKNSIQPTLERTPSTGWRSGVSPSSWERDVLDLHKSGNELSLNLHKYGNELSLDLHKSGNELSLDLHNSSNEFI